MPPLNLTKDLAPLREAARNRIDEAAEMTRGRYLTPGSGQAMVYDQKRREAESYMIKTTAGDPIVNAEFPHLYAEATKNEITMYDQAVIHLTMAQLWLTISPMIEMMRLSAKDAVTAAMTPAAIQAAAEVNWPSLAPS